MVTPDDAGTARQRPLFDFRFCPLAETIASSGRDSLVWFWLTDGWYGLNVGDEQLFRYADAWLAAHPADPDDTPPYAEYVVVRLWEVVLELFPEVLEPIPPDLWERVNTPDRAAAWMQAADQWLEANDGDTGDLHAWNLYYTATGWYDQRKLSTMPITPQPSIWFLRVGDTIRVRWDNRDVLDDGIPAWSASVGEIALSVDQFMAEVASLNDRLIAQMRDRVEASVAYWSRPGHEIDPAHLLGDHAGPADHLRDSTHLRQDHARRTVQLRDRLTIPLAPTDWDAVRRALATIGP